MDAALGFGGGNALHAMDAAFIFQLGVNLVALNGGDYFFEATDGGGELSRISTFQPCDSA